jgi:hypothetical protein
MAENYPIGNAWCSEFQKKIRDQYDGSAFGIGIWRSHVSQTNFCQKLLEINFKKSCRSFKVLSAAD